MTTRPGEPGRAPDMSPEAIDLRLRELAKPYRLWESLKRGRWIGPVEEDRVGES